QADIMGDSRRLGDLTAIADEVEEIAERLDRAAGSVRRGLHQEQLRLLGPPLVYGDMSVRLLVRRHIDYAVRADADAIAIVPAEVPAQRFGHLEGMRATYDNTYVQIYLEEMRLLVRDAYARSRYGRD